MACRYLVRTTYMHIAITGTRHGMTKPQIDWAWDMLTLLHSADAPPDSPSRLFLHHGDCVGADATIHALADALRITTVVHPPDKDKYRAFCVPTDGAILTPQPYLARDRIMVYDSARLLAFPRQDHEVSRSGTWYTVRFAEDKIPTTIVYPDGRRELRGA